MLFRDNLAEERDPFSDWPKGFYEERNPEKREKLILEKIRRLQEEQSENGKREEEKREEEKLASKDTP